MEEKVLRSNLTVLSLLWGTCGTVFFQSSLIMQTDFLIRHFFHFFSCVKTANT